MPWITELPSGAQRAGYRDPATKRKVQKSFDYWFEANDWLTAQGHPLKGTPAEAAPIVVAPVVETPPIVAPARDVPTVGAYVVAYVERHADVWEASTRSSSRSHARYIESRSGLGHLPIDRLSAQDVETWRARMKREAVSDSMRRARMKMLRAALSEAARDDSTGVTHAQWRSICDVKAPAPSRRRVRIVTAKHERALLQACETIDERAFLLLGLDAGLRWGEVAGLTAEAIDLDRGLITVAQVVDDRGGDLRPYAKNGHDDDLVPIVTDRLSDVLRDLVALRPSGLLLPPPPRNRKDARPFWRYETWRRAFWAVLTRRAGIDPAPRFHDLRHTLGSRLADGGLPTTQIRDVLRHADEATTLRYITTPNTVALGVRAAGALRRAEDAA